MLQHNTEHCLLCSNIVHNNSQYIHFNLVYLHFIEYISPLQPSHIYLSHNKTQHHGQLNTRLLN